VRWDHGVAQLSLQLEAAWRCRKAAPKIVGFHNPRRTAQSARSSFPPSVLMHGADQTEAPPPPQLQPPASKLELARDDLLLFMSRSYWGYLAIVHLFLIIGDGALFFFLLMGWQTLCGPNFEPSCERRDTTYNISVQILNGLFTYGVLVTMPWRLANTHHLWCSRRSSQAGCDFYGKPTEAIWFHIPPAHRKGIMALLLLGNTLGQFANQATRIVYFDFELQATSPGSIWTQVFFFQNFACAFAGAIYQAVQERRLRLGQSGRFPPGPLEEAKGLYLKWRARGSQTAVSVAAESGPQGPMEMVTASSSRRVDDAADNGSSHLDLQRVLCAGAGGDGD